MESVTAECISRKKIFNGIRLTEFEYIYFFNSGIKHDTFNIVCVDYDLEVVWKVRRSHQNRIDYSCTPERTVYSCYWDEITLTKFSKSIYGNIMINRNYGEQTFSVNFNKEDFACKKSIFKIYIEKEHFIFFKAQVCSEDGSVPSTIADYSKFLTNKEMCDVLLVIETEEISAHKQILSARSDVFARMFDSDMKEKATGRVEIPDVEPDIFKQFLEYLYTGRVGTTDYEDLKKLLTVAHKYAVVSLVSICGYRISEKLSVDNAVDNLILADLVKEDFLKKDCMKFILKNKDKVGATEKYKEMIKSHTSLLSEIFLLDIK